MGYRVEYGQDSNQEKAAGRLGRILVLTVILFVMFLVLVNLFWPQGAAMVRQALIPGDAAVTVGALEGLAQDLKAGDSIEAALQSFCRTVLEGAGIGPG